eukprot:1565540-Rhodomonas_salina.3
MLARSFAHIPRWTFASFHPRNPVPNPWTDLVEVAELGALSCAMEPILKVQRREVLLSVLASAAKEEEI